MINEIIKYLVRFLLLILIQGLIVKNIELGIYINPFLYVLLIIALPFNIPKWLLLTVAFFTGLTVDVFYDTIGIHASACVFMAYCRPYVYNLFSPRGGYESSKKPSVRDLGISWFLSTTAILIVLHHLVLFYLEVFKLSEFFQTFLRIILSSAFSILFVLLGQYTIYRNKE